jgi:hypothetical protein
MGKWIVNIILGLLVTLAILVLIQLGVNIVNGIYL